MAGLTGTSYNSAPFNNSGGTTDHSALNNLNSDDHPQYHNDARGDARYFTQAQVLSQIASSIAGLVDSSPAALDTLNDLAAALNDDPNFATTITNALALKADNVRQIIAGTGLNGGGNLTADRTINLSNTAVTPGIYKPFQIVVNAQGQITNIIDNEYFFNQVTTDRETTGGVSLPVASDFPSMQVAQSETRTLAGGIYRISWEYWWSCDSTTQDFVGVITIDGNIVNNPAGNDNNQGAHIEEVQDSGGTGNGGTNQRRNHFGSTDIPLAAGDHTVEILNSKTGGGGAESNIHHSKIWLERVG